MGRIKKKREEKKQEILFSRAFILTPKSYGFSRNPKPTTRFSSSGTSSLWAFIIFPSFITLKAMASLLSRHLQNCVLVIFEKLFLNFYVFVKIS